MRGPHVRDVCCVDANADDNNDHTCTYVYRVCTCDIFSCIIIICRACVPTQAFLALPASILGGIFDSEVHNFFIVILRQREPAYICHRLFTFTRCMRVYIVSGLEGNPYGKLGFVSVIMELSDV